MMFSGKPEDVVGRLSGRCIDSKWTVTSSSATELVCEAPLNFGQSVLGQLMMGNSYSTPPRRFFRFNAATVNGVSRVQASGWMELQMAFGQMKRTDFAGPEFQNSIMLFMLSAGGKYPVGTTFPNHAYLGTEYQPVQNGKTYGMTITSLDADAPGSRSGLLVGDTIVSIAGKKFKSTGDILDGFAKGAKTDVYPVTVLRSGREMTVSVARGFKQPSTEVVAAVVDANSASAPTASNSLADELGKLAKLKADGVLSDAEFQTQKAKLLAR